MKVSNCNNSGVVRIYDATRAARVGGIRYMCTCARTPHSMCDLAAAPLAHSSITIHPANRPSIVTLLLSPARLAVWLRSSHRRLHNALPHLFLVAPPAILNTFVSVEAPLHLDATDQRRAARDRRRMVWMVVGSTKTPIVYPRDKLKSRTNSEITHL